MDHAHQISILGIEIAPTENITSIKQDNGTLIVKYYHETSKTVQMIKLTFSDETIKDLIFKNAMREWSSNLENDIPFEMFLEKVEQHVKESFRCLKANVIDSFLAYYKMFLSVNELFLYENKATDYIVKFFNEDVKKATDDIVKFINDDAKTGDTPDDFHQVEFEAFFKVLNKAGVPYKSMFDLIDSI